MSATKTCCTKEEKVGGGEKVGGNRRNAEVLRACFIENIKYTTWLANVVLVRKPNGKWRMCTNYIDLNKACPKDSYPLSSLDCLVDGALGQAKLSILDAYFDYIQILMNNVC